MAGRKIILTAAVHFIMCVPVFAAHPLITDDTGTQGKGATQIELNAEYDAGGETGVAALALSLGAADGLDAVIGAPYITSKEASGISDVTIELKWRFYETEGLSLALKPGLTLPTGDDENGLGAGKLTYGAFLIATKEAAPALFLLNLGYRRNENVIGDREDIWHASLAGEIETVEDLQVVGNLGMERNTDVSSDTNPAFAIAGLIYSITDDLALDVGLRLALDSGDIFAMAGLSYGLD